MDIFQKPNDITVNLLLCDHRTHMERFLICSALVTNVAGDVSKRFYGKYCFIVAYLAGFPYCLVANGMNSNVRNQTLSYFLDLYTWYC